MSFESNVITRIESLEKDVNNLREDVDYLFRFIKENIVKKTERTSSKDSEASG